MPEINFYLKSVQPDKKGLVPVIAQINIDYKKYRKTVEKIKKKHWNKKKQRVRPSGLNEPYNRHVEINTFLDEYEQKTRSFFSNCIKEGIKIDEHVIKSYFAGKKVLPGETLPFFQAFDAFLESKKADRAKWTIKGYNSVLNFLKAFQYAMDIDINFQNIDMIFFDELKKYAFEYKEIKDNYFAKIIAVLKNFMNWSEIRGYHTNSVYKRFSYTEKEIDIIYLTIDELLYLYNFDFEHNRHNKARDLYCFSCFTGLRYSDITQLKHEHIKGNVILKKIQKTKEVEKIPLNDFAIEILNKYKDLPLYALPHISGQKANKYIKEACKLAEIATPVVKTESRGGKVIEIIKPKYEFITMHTGRKTFVTNSLILGMNVKAIKGITGHKKDSTFEKYLKIVEEYKKTEMDNTWNKIVR